ncbi:hypothetical protein KCU93_g4737, partial [Aureobasidium melanogenum]
MPFSKVPLLIVAFLPPKAKLTEISDANMILSTKAVGTKTYRVDDGNGISAVTNVTYNTMRAQNPEYAIHTQSRYDED